MWARRLTQYIFIGRLILWPDLSVGKIAGIMLPTPLRIIDPLLQSLTLNVMGDMQIEFKDSRSLVNQHLLKIANMSITLLPHFLADKVFDPRYQNVFVMATVPDANLAPRRTRVMATP